MYLVTLAFHSLLRWVVLALGIVAFGRAVTGMRGRRAWTPADNRAGQMFVGMLDLQLLLGIVLYLFLSPITSVAFRDFGAAMSNSAVRYWAVEHIVGMVISVALAHVGRVRVRRATEPARRHKLAAIFFGLALAVMLASIPWPGMPAARPLFRGF